jgi:hypothetical protein
MYYGDHPPPHFHARAGEEEAKIEIATGEVVAGSLSRRSLRLVREWLSRHRGELEVNWELLLAGKPPRKVEPLP